MTKKLQTVSSSFRLHKFDCFLNFPISHKTRLLNSTFLQNEFLLLLIHKHQRTPFPGKTNKSEPPLKRKRKKQNQKQGVVREENEKTYMVGESEGVAERAASFSEAMAGPGEERWEAMTSRRLFISGLTLLWFAHLSFISFPFSISF